MADVHKDFHGALSYGLQFVEEQYGMDGVRAFLEGLADTVYKPLVEALRTTGLDALREHWRHVFGLEEGSFDMRMDGDTLVLTVHRCPAVAHLKENHYWYSEHFCEHTRIVNEAVCRAAGYESSVAYDQDGARCVQRFRRVAS